MKKLTEVGQKTGTDKALYHGFTEVYDDVFKNYESPRLLEIGVYNFSSIKMYIEYFKNPYIIGMDIDDKQQYLSNDWKFIRGDQSKIEDLKKCVEGEDLFDIILDDGGHSMKQQQVSFGFMIDYVKPGGFYILEDLHTSFNKIYIESDCQVTSYDMLKLIKEGKTSFSNYIDLDQQIKILNKIEYVDIFARDNNDLTDSVTSIIKIKK